MGWGYAFLRTTSHAPGLEDLLVQAVEMYLMGEEERNVKTSNYEGKLYTQRRPVEINFKALASKACDQFLHANGYPLL